MHEVLKYINEHLDRKLLTEELAALAGYSPWHFCVLFKSYTGYTVTDYLLGRRMRLAAVDVMHGDRVTDIAARYGYDTQCGFDKAFIRYYGCAPRNYAKTALAIREQYERRRETMFKLSDRSVLLRERAVEHRRGDENINCQRAYYFVKAFKELPPEHRTNMKCLSAGLSLLLENFEPVLFDDELFAGYNYSLTSEDEIYALEYFTQVAPERRACIYRMLEKSLIGPEKARELLDFLEAGLYTPTPDPKFPDVSHFTPEQLGVLNETAAFSWCFPGNHSAIGHWMVAQKGFDGIIAELKAAQNTAQTDEQREFYECSLQVAAAASHMGERYAEACRKKAALATDDRTRAELIELAGICTQVPRLPARTLREAIQAIWFSHIINCWEDDLNANSLGRLDQYLFPWYDADIKAGRITKKEAFDLICGLWLKLYRDYDVQQCTVGGCLADGSTAVNDLSYLMLDATEALDFIRDISVRFDCKTTPVPFLRRALEVVGHLQKGVPFFFNDEPIIKGMLSKGISINDARGYANIGCVETALPGIANTHPVAVQVNALKGVEYMLGNGESLMNPGTVCGPRTGDPCSFTTFEQLLDAAKTQIVHVLTTGCAANEAMIPPTEHNRPLIYKSLLTEGCIETGKHFNSGVSGPKYICYQTMIHGLPNAVDSLMAIKTLVFDKKRFSMEELLYQLKNNFPSEAFRQELLKKAPKYGNDIEEVDCLAREVFACACDAVNNFNGSGNGYFASPFSFLWMFDQGRISAASADGRRRGEVLAYSVSPMQGRDYSGLTALMNSISKLPTEKAPGVASAIVEVDPLLFCDSNLDLMVQLLLSAAEQGLSNVQFNITDRDTLLDAQRNPGKYSNLAVRVSGFSQKFNLLDKEVQDHIIARTKHKTV